MPLPNGFLKTDALSIPEPEYPLSVGICQQCSLMQLVDVVNPDIMFHNYVYIPSASQTRIENFKGIVTELTNFNPQRKNSLAVDIGSNDGSLLLEFKNIGVNVLGVDPAENLSKIAELKGIPTLNTYFSAVVAKKMVKTYGHAHYSTATNVVAHVNDLHDFFNGIKTLLSKDGIFLCEFPYVVDLLNKNLFDTIYQEHLSYFAVRPLVQLIHQRNLKIVHIRRTPIDGGALRIMIARDDSSYKEAATSLDELLHLEQKLNLSNPQTYKTFGQKVKSLKKEIKKTLQTLKKKGKTIAGYGAAARGNILMNYCHIGKREIDFIVDSTPYKQGLYTPGTHIKIFPEEKLVERRPDYVLILAWNFAEEIMQKQKEYQKLGGKFIIPVPHVTIV